MMKKITLVLFTLVTVFGCTACGQARSENMGEIMKKAGLSCIDSYFDYYLSVGLYWKSTEKKTG